MKWIAFFILFLIAVQGFAQNKVTYVGTIGDTNKIEMEITTINNKDYTGRYRFQGKKEWILLKGAMYIDNRNRVAQNLVLYEFMDNRDTSVFDLYMNGKTLNGTWQRTKQSPIFQVILMEGKAEPSNAFDGFYYVDQNELKVKTISDNIIEVNVLMTKSNTCVGFHLQGQLYKMGDQWKGSLAELNDKGEATVIISFKDDKANMEIIPAFLPEVKCQIVSTPYMRQMQKESGQLR